MKKGGNKWNNFRSKSKGAVMFPNVKFKVFLCFSFCCLYVCFFRNTVKIQDFTLSWAFLKIGCKKLGQ